MLIFGNGAALGYLYTVACMFRIARIVRLITLGDAQVFPILRMLDEPVHGNHYRILHFVGHDHSAQNAFYLFVF